MPPIEYPLAFGHWHVQDDKLMCRMPRKELEIRAPGGLLGAVLALCSGRLRWKAVADQLAAQWEAGCVDDFLLNLVDEGALVEASHSLGHWTEELAQAPTAYPRLASPGEVVELPRAARHRLLPGRGALGTPVSSGAIGLEQLLKTRASYRTFADISISPDALGAILWAAHGVARAAADGSDGWHRTVASGGNMHSARWFVFVLRELAAPDSKVVRPGWYEARFHVEGGTSLEALRGSADDAWRVIVDPRALTFASALVLPVYDISLPARKYGNRATFFASIEAGQCLQNAQIMAVAVGAAACVRGDIAADAVNKLVYASLPGDSKKTAHYLPMPALLLGAKPNAQEVGAESRDGGLQIGAFGSVRAHDDSLVHASGGPDFAFHGGPVQEGPREIFTCGRSPDPRIAVAKAEAEAWERRGWATLGQNIEGAAGDVHAAMNPALLVGYTRRQHASAGFPLAPFSPRRKYLWREGVDALTGERVSIPAECVHALSALPPAFRARPCTNSSTSGIAAWISQEGALCRATLELIERDAFLRQWLSRRAALLIEPGTIPLYLRTRIGHLQAAGHRIGISQVRGALVPVFSVFVQSLARPFTAITTAADFDPEAALAKALDEAEGRAAHAATFPAAPLKSAHDVQSPADINRFYQTPRFYRRSDFYAAGAASDPFGLDTDRFCADWSALQSRIRHLHKRLLAVEITPAGASIHQGRTPLHVVRAFIPGLLPIWFQYGLQPAAAVATAPRGLSDAAFIHPFT